jgi:DNA polymerase-3 subunit delta'
MNWEMVGHQWVINLLKDQIAKNASRHAYLIAGPKGIGRRTLAIRLAQALNCPNAPSPGTPCLTCRTCLLIDQMQHPDLAVVQSDHEGGTLKVDQIRSLQHVLSLSPYDAVYRVAILLRFEEASTSAANALLKTLEEPPAQVIIILTAESGERLLPTIVSRCELLRLRPVSVDEVSLGLSTKWNISKERANLLAHISGGRPGFALRLQNEPELLENRNQWIGDLDRLISASLVERFNYAEKMAKDKDTLIKLLQIWLSFWRDVLIFSMDASLKLTNLDHETEIKHLANKLNVNQTRQFVSKLEQTIVLLSNNVNTRMATEVLLLDLPKL